MLLLIIGLHFVLGSIWLINSDQFFFGVLSFAVGMAATHYGWKQLAAKKRPEGGEDDVNG